MSISEAPTVLPPLEVLFEKPQICNPKISPNGRYLIWMERDTLRNVLNFQASVFDSDKDLSTPAKGKQLSFFDDYDACVFYTISEDDRYIIFLREPVLGKEMYHLYTIDLLKVHSEELWDENVWEYACRTPNPSMTCSIGFCGGVQLWPSKSNPTVIRLATGHGALFWDLSEINLDTNEITIIERNPIQLGSWWNNPVEFFSLSCIALRTIANIAGTYLFENIFGINNLICPARVPVEWLLDSESLKPRGRAEVSLEIAKGSSDEASKIGRWKPEIHLSWSCAYDSNWKCLNTVPLGDLNMHLVGAAGGTGTARMDFIDENIVDVHLCRKEDEFTRYERFDLRDVNKSQTIANATDSDIMGFLRNPAKNTIDAVLYETEKVRISPLVSTSQPTDYDRLKDAFITRLKDKTISSDSMNKKDCLPSFYPVSRTKDNKIWIVYAYADRGNLICDDCPEAYFIFKNYLTGGDDLSLWKIHRPLLKSYYEVLGNQQTLNIKSRDGANLLCFLTIPSKKVIGGRKNLPLVVFPHGGPNWRDTWGYDPMLQALSVQGYVVLQVQFRGSTGFGMSFMKAGMEGGFCTTIQKDIVDSVHFVLESIVICESSGEKLVIEPTSMDSKASNYTLNSHILNGITCDPNRVAILGGSFGGYCSLFGVTLLNSLSPRYQYCCGIAFAALYSVGAASKLTFRGDPIVKSYWRRVYGKTICDNEDNAKSVSPIFHIDNVKVPMMISHGVNDSRCPIDSADLFCGKLSEKGLVRYIRYQDEGHGLRKERNVLHNWAMVLDFLGRAFKTTDFKHDILTQNDIKTHSGSIMYTEKQ